jgi:hypothetical protein
LRGYLKVRGGIYSFPRVLCVKCGENAVIFLKKFTCPGLKVAIRREGIQESILSLLERICFQSSSYIGSNPDSLLRSCYFEDLMSFGFNAIDVNTTFEVEDDTIVLASITQSYKVLSHTLPSTSPNKTLVRIVPAIVVELLTYLNVVMSIFRCSSLCISLIDLWIIMISSFMISSPPLLCLLLG